MQQDNNIQKKLRELDEAQAPDLSNMDAHWQQMAAMLQPGAVPVKKAWPKWMMNTLSVVTVAVMITGALWYLSSKRDRRNSSIAKQNNVVANEKVNTSNAAISSDTSSEETLVQTTPASNIQYVDEPTGSGDDLMEAAAGSVFDSLTINFTDCKTCPSKKLDSAVFTATRKKLLENLFAQLQKEEQKFIIDNSRDTLLQFEEGTALLVPANSFGGMNGVEIAAKEFYKTSDIVLNQLNTASNKEQLVTDGMLQLTASYKNSEVQIDKQKPLLLFMPDTSSLMNGMQLFYGERAIQNGDTGYVSLQQTEAAAGKIINWVSQPQRFSNQHSITLVKVLNLVNMPCLVKEKNGKKIAFFLIDENTQLPKEAIKSALKEKYGYDKIKLRNAEWWEVHDRTLTWAEKGTRYFNSFYATKIGDSMWMEKEIADKYKLGGTSTKTVPAADYYIPFNYRGNRTASTALEQQFDKLSSQAAQGLQNKYAVNISQLGWINCDRFYSDSRKKIQYQVDLGDSATNYYTMLIFDNIKSVMTGFVDGKKVMFQNIPLGEPVKIISIGINKKGETVYSVTNTTTSNQELTGLQFESVSAPELKTVLSKMDQ